MEAVIGKLQVLKVYIDDCLAAVEFAKRTGGYGDYDTLEQFQEARLAEALTAITTIGWDAEKEFRNA